MTIFDLLYISMEGVWTNITQYNPFIVVFPNMNLSDPSLYDSFYLPSVIGIIIHQVLLNFIKPLYYIQENESNKKICNSIKDGMFNLYDNADSSELLELIKLKEIIKDICDQYTNQNGGNNILIGGNNKFINNKCINKVLCDLNHMFYGGKKSNNKFVGGNNENIDFYNLFYDLVNKHINEFKNDKLKVFLTYRAFLIKLFDDKNIEYIKKILVNIPGSNEPCIICTYLKYFITLLILCFKAVLIDLAIISHDIIALNLMAFIFNTYTSISTLIIPLMSSIGISASISAYLTSNVSMIVITLIIVFLSKFVEKLSLNIMANLQKELSKINNNMKKLQENTNALEDNKEHFIFKSISRFFKKSHMSFLKVRKKLIEIKGVLILPIFNISYNINFILNKLKKIPIICVFIIFIYNISDIFVEITHDEYNNLLTQLTQSYNEESANRVFTDEATDDALKRKLLEQVENLEHPNDVNEPCGIPSIKGGSNSSYSNGNKQLSIGNLMSPLFMLTIFKKNPSLYKYLDKDKVRDFFKNNIRKLRLTIPKLSLKKLNNAIKKINEASKHIKKKIKQRISKFIYNLKKTLRNKKKIK